MPKQSDLTVCYNIISHNILSVSGVNLVNIQMNIFKKLLYINNFNQLILASACFQPVSQLISHQDKVTVFTGGKNASIY